MARAAPGRAWGAKAGLLAGGGSHLLNVGTEAANRVIGAPALVANLSGYSKRKRMRSCALVLSVPGKDGAAARPLERGNLGRIGPDRSSPTARLR